MLLSTVSNAQRVGINSVQIDSSAVMEIKSDSLGILIPRLDSLNIQNITKPAKSLLLYQKNGKEGFKYFNGSEWKAIIKENTNIIYIHPDSIHIDSIYRYIMNLSYSGEALFHYDTLSSPKQVWYWNGSNTVKIWDKNILGVKTVANYSALRALTNYPHDIVIIENWTYTGPDNQIYTTLGGVFKRVPTGKENYGIVIVGNDGSVWERDWDHIHVQPEWFEIGGNTVMFGTGGRPIYNESERLFFATSIIAEIPGRVLELFPNKVYISDNSNFLSSKVTINGNNATIKRADTPIVLTTSSLTIGQTNISVDDASSLRTGLTIIAATGDGVGQNQYLGTITNIDGNNITFSEPAVQNMEAGSKLIKVSNFLSANTSEYMGEQVIRQVIFDGNVANNNHTFDWKYNNTIRSAGANGGFLNIYDCVFTNTPSENINISKGLVRNCKGMNLFGSFVHIGNANPSNLGGVTVKSCYVDGVVMGDPDKSGHGFGFIEFSSNPINTCIEDCRVINSNFGEILASFGPENSYIKISGSYFGNFKKIGSFSYGLIEIEAGDIFIENSIFESCGDLSFLGNNVRRGLSFNKISIKDNIFVNSRLSFRNVSQVYIENNKFLYENGLYGFNGWTSSLTPHKAMLSFLQFDQIKISNNDIIGPIETDMDHCAIGLALINEDDDFVRLDANNNLTKFSYAQNIDVLNNHVAWFHKGIISNGYQSDRSSIRQVIGWKYHGNTVYMTKASSNPLWCSGIHVQSGVDCRNNVVFYGNALSTNFGIVAQGIDNATDAETLLGAIVCNNTIIGAPDYRSILVGAIDGSITNQYNNIVKDNIVSGTIQVIGGTNSFVSNNIVLNSTILPGYISPPITPKSYGWKEKSGSY